MNDHWRAIVSTVARALITLALLSIAAKLLLTATSTEHDALALSIIGAVVGYWLRHAEAVQHNENGG